MYRYYVSMRVLQLALLSLFLCGCSSEEASKKTIRIGLDPSWYPLNLGSQTTYVNGFTEDLLLEVAQYTGLKLEKILDNSGDLLSGLKTKKYDAIFTSLPPYPFHLAVYSFSHNILNLGPVFVVSAESPYTKLEEINEGAVGFISGDPAGLILQNYPNVILRNYASIPNLLDAIEEGAIVGALLDKIPAVNYVSDLYADKLKIVSAPMTDQGIHLVAEKDERETFLRAFNQSLEHLQKKKKIKPLLKKWQL